MFEHLIFTKEYYHKNLEKIKHLILKQPHIETPSKLAAILFIFDESISKIHVFVDESSTEVIIYSNSKLNDYALNFIRQNKNNSDAYNIVVKVKTLKILHITKQQITI